MLPDTFDQRPFGVELEFFGITSVNAVNALRAAGVFVADHAGIEPWALVGGLTTTAPIGSINRVNGSWAAGRDPTVAGSGLEFRSPPLQGAEGFAALRLVMDTLKRAGGRTNVTCGGHVHHDATGIASGIGTTADAIGRFALSYWSNADHIDTLVAPSRRLGAPTRRNGERFGAGYCERPNPSTVGVARALIGDQARTRRSAMGRADLPDGLRGMLAPRYCTVNLKALPAHGTIELRQHQGTLDYDKLAVWIQLGQALFDLAERGVSLPEAPTFDAFVAELPEHLRPMLVARRAALQRQATGAVRARETRERNAEAAALARNVRWAEAAVRRYRGTVPALSLPAYVLQMAERYGVHQVDGLPVVPEPTEPLGYVGPDPSAWYADARATGTR